MNAEGYEATAERVGALARFGLQRRRERRRRNHPAPAREVRAWAVPGGTVAVFESGDVDLGAAERRLEERRATLRSELERAQRKLSDEGFVAKGRRPSWRASAPSPLAYAAER